MKAISFKLSGKFAHFKKPDVNSYAYFTYSNIHKIAILGILGSILGLKGYQSFYKEYKHLGKDFPQFYEKLKNFKISIIPKKPYFNKKIITFNNSVGYASKEEGGNLIVREQWLENPEWEILILENNNEEFKNLKQKLFNNESVYIPYLGKNDHFANISEVKEIELKKLNSHKNLICYSLIPRNIIKLNSPPLIGNLFFYEEYLPIELEKNFLSYIYEKMVLTNYLIECNDNWCFEYNSKMIYFI